MRVTPDTGILVRMNAKAAGPARKLLEEILAGQHKLLLSEFLLMETARVLSYPRMQKLYGPSSGDAPGISTNMSACCASARIWFTQ
jgi:predicted nucleic acid-binding protein